MSVWACVCLQRHVRALPCCWCWRLVWWSVVLMAAGSSVWLPAPAPLPNAVSPRESGTSEEVQRKRDHEQTGLHAEWTKVKICIIELWHCFHTLLGCGAGAADPFCFPLTAVLPKISSIWKQEKTKWNRWHNILCLFKECLRQNKIFIAQAEPKFCYLLFSCYRIDPSPGCQCSVGFWSPLMGSLGLRCLYSC